MGVIRISDRNYFWLMNTRGAGSVDDILDILHDHVLNNKSIQHRLYLELDAEYLSAKKKGSNTSTK